MKQALTLRAQDRRLGFYLLLPSIIILFAIIVYPIGYSLWLSFHNLNINNPAKGQQFVGLQNYIDVLKSSDWWMSILRILYFVAADLIVGISLGLAIALLLNKERKGKGIVLAIVVFPYILAPIVNSLIWKLIYDPNYIGGGAMVRFERVSLGILFSLLASAPYLARHRVSAGMFWFLRETFEAIGGFNESLVSAEDLDFALRLKAYGKTRGKRYGTIWRHGIITSCRKFDRFGDWYFFRNPRVVKEIFKGTNRKVTDKVYYDVDR